MDSDVAKGANEPQHKGFMGQSGGFEWIFEGPDQLMSSFVRLEMDTVGQDRYLVTDTVFGFEVNNFGGFGNATRKPDRVMSRAEVCDWLSSFSWQDLGDDILNSVPSQYRDVSPNYKLESLQDLLRATILHCASEIRSDSYHPLFSH